MIRVVAFVIAWKFYIEVEVAVRLATNSEFLWRIHQLLKCAFSCAQYFNWTRISLTFEKPRNFDVDQYLTARKLCGNQRVQD